MGLMTENNFVLYNYFRSSASYRVRIALNLKQIKYDYKSVHLVNNGGEQFAPEYGKLNPSRDVPTLVHNGKPLGQSVAIIQYLDQIEPYRPLFPVEAYKRALVFQAIEIINSGVQPLVNLRPTAVLTQMFGANEEQKKAWTMHWYAYGMQTLETFLSAHAGKYSFGDEVTAADCYVIPHLFGGERFGVTTENYPTLARIRENCLKLEEFAKAHPMQQPDAPKTP
jgi:maleylacetoacetate isomerase